MVYAPAFQGLNLKPLQGLEEMFEAIEQYKKAMQAVRQFPIRELQSAQEALKFNSIQPGLNQLQQLQKATKLYQTNLFPAVPAAQELVRQQQQIHQMIQDVRSSIRVVQQFPLRRWTVLAGLSGLSLSATAPLWVSVTGAAPPTSQLPAVTLTDIATILAGEAGRLTSIALDLAAHHAEAVFTERTHQRVAMYVIAGLATIALNRKPSLRDMRRLMFWMPLVFAFLEWAFQAKTE